MKPPSRLPGIFQSESALRAVQLGVAAIAIGIVFWKLQFSTSAICCGDADGYYHIKWTQTLWASIKSGHFPQFPWLPLTTLNSKDYVDHHLLFHIFQIPFVAFSDPRLGAKIGLGITGIAGPGGATPGKKVGLTYVAVDSDDHSAVKKYEWPYDREGNRLASVGAALDLLEKAIG